MERRPAAPHGVCPDAGDRPADSPAAARALERRAMRRIPGNHGPIYLPAV